MLRSTFLHSGWEFAEEGWLTNRRPFDRGHADWLPAQVPGHVHLDLVENGIIADPFVRMNELGCQWVDERDWRYRTRFEFHHDPDLPRRVLHFEGLDTIATIWLNGDQVGSSDNMFVPLEIDVSDLLREGENELEVRFRSAVTVGRERRKAYFEANGLPEDTRNFDERAFVRKAQYMFGWDWGPRLVSSGIWRPVRLIEYESRILDVQVSQEWREDRSVEIRISCKVDGEGDVTVFPVSDWSMPAHWNDFETAEGGRGARCIVMNPRHWWPNGEGERNLHLAVVCLRHNGRDLDSTSITLGFRYVELVREPDQFGESFEFKVNGHPLWVRGANWIPDHSFPSVVSQTRYREQILRAKELGFNMLRVWGGGLYETEEFYRLCDEHGILVWQDLPFACSYYPDDVGFQEAVAAEAAANIKRIRNHPSLALWCGNNENHMMWQGKWGGPEHSPPRYFGLGLYRDTIPRVLAELDPTRAYIESSPIGALTDSDDDDVNRNHFGDQHYWAVWHGGDWRKYTDSEARFSSEYGFLSCCHRELLDRVLEKEEKKPDSAAVRWHDKSGKTWNEFLELVNLHYPEPKDLDDWIYYSQLNQRDAIRLAIEHYRMSEFCQGSLIWQFNDCWPVQSWSVVDFDGNPKAAAHELKRLHAPVICSIVRDKDWVQLWVASDDPQALALLTFGVYDLSTGSVRLVNGAVVTCDPLGDTPRQVAELSLKGLSVPDIIIAGGEPHRAAWQLAVEPKAARFGPPAPLKASCYHDGFLTLTSETPLIDLMLTSDGSVKPFIENFITIVTPGNFRVPLNGPIGKLRARSLAGNHEVRMVRGPL